MNVANAMQHQDPQPDGSVKHTVTVIDGAKPSILFTLADALAASELTRIVNVSVTDYQIIP